MKEIWFDMDGTIADLYGVNDWLNCLIKGYTKPYREAKPLIDMRQLGREIKRLQNAGYTIGIISWLSKNGTEEYNKKVTKAKNDWLKKHLGSVQFNSVQIVEYGTPKYTLGKGILFDDEKPNREAWTINNELAFDVNNILNVLKAIA